jgi:hypothetical protein
VSPKATIDGIVPGVNYFAAWFLLAVVTCLLIGIETRVRTTEELDASFARPRAAAEQDRWVAARRWRDRRRSKR